MTFKQLQKSQCREGAEFVEITDKNEALNQINSKTSCCWGAGGKIGDTGWIQLAIPSPRSKGDIRTVFVCKESLIK